MKKNDTMAVVPVEQQALSTVERGEFGDCERVIEKGLRTFTAVGSALLTIREKRFYREHYNTFEDYCQHKWDIGARRGQQLMASAEAARNLLEANHGSPGENGEGTSRPMPTSERQVRPLAGLPVDDQVKTWDEAVKATGGEVPTGKDVEKARRKVMGEPEVAEATVDDAMIEIAWGTLVGVLGGTRDPHLEKHGCNIMFWQRKMVLGYRTAAALFDRLIDLGWLAGDPAQPVASKVLAEEADEPAERPHVQTLDEVKGPEAKREPSHLNKIDYWITGAVSIIRHCSAKKTMELDAFKVSFWQRVFNLDRKEVERLFDALIDQGYLAGDPPRPTAKVSADDGKQADALVDGSSTDTDGLSGKLFGLLDQAIKALEKASEIYEGKSGWMFSGWIDDIESFKQIETERQAMEKKPGPFVVVRSLVEGKLDPKTRFLTKGRGWGNSLESAEKFKTYFAAESCNYTGDYVMAVEDVLAQAPAAAKKGGKRAKV